MMIPDKFLLDEQDPRAIDKVLGKLTDMLSSNEELIYIAVQKRPAVNLLPDCIAVSNKRIFYCEPGNFGITMNFKDISWKSIHEVTFKEELFGSKFTCTPIQGVPIVTDFIPKLQARKLYQVAHEQLENYKEQQLLLKAEAQQTIKEPSKGALFQDTEQFEEAVIVNQSTLPDGESDLQSTNAFDPLQTATIPVQNAPIPAQVVEPVLASAPEPEDETTLKLRKLKSLYDKQLITLEEYELKKASILDSF
jgi:hypothetical protein